MFFHHITQNLRIGWRQIKKQPPVWAAAEAFSEITAEWRSA
jgi:hypothetical protein